MSAEVQPIDITDSAELLHLAEEVQRSGISRLLKRGDKSLALLMPVDPPRDVQSRQPAADKRDSLLNIIGIGESAESTNIAQHEGEYLAEAYMPTRR
jgi:hypothetical protein